MYLLSLDYFCFVCTEAMRARLYRSLRYVIYLNTTTLIILLSFGYVILLAFLFDFLQSRRLKLVYVCSFF
jgi:hypothetical protein